MQKPKVCHDVLRPCMLAVGIHVEMTRVLGRPKHLTFLRSWGEEDGHGPGRVELAVCDADSKGPPPHTQGWAGGALAVYPSDTIVLATIASSTFNI